MTNKSLGNNTGGSLGLLPSVMMIVGGMIGSAIFSLTGLTIYNAGPAALISWSIAAAIMLCYGLIVAELSTIFPKSGGVFVFPAKALGKTRKTGRLWGWISTWGYINANIVAVAFAAIYVGTYLGVGFPVFEGMQIPLAIISIIIIFGLNIIKFSVAGKANTILVVALLATLMTFVIVGMTSGAWDSAMLSPFFTQGANGATGFISSVPTAMVGYGSIVAIAFMVSEVKNPNRTVPKAVLIAMCIVYAVYFLIILTTVGLVSSQFLAENPGMKFIPLYAAAFTKLMSIPWLSQVISISAVIALFTTMLVVMALTSRAIKAAADDGMLPKILGKNSKNGTPMIATVLVAICSIVVSCFPQFTTEIVGLAALFSSLTIIINCVSLIEARKKNKLQAGHFRAPGGKLLPIITMAIIILCYIPDIMKGGWLLWAYTIGWYAVGLIIYAARKKHHMIAED